jgi:hypothetical protein
LAQTMSHNMLKDDQSELPCERLARRLHSSEMVKLHRRRRAEE